MGCKNTPVSIAPTTEDTLQFNQAFKYYRADQLDSAEVGFTQFLQQCTAIHSEMYMTAIRRLSWVKLATKQQQAALQLMLRGDSLAHEAGDIKMQAMFRFANGRYMVTDNEEEGLAYMKEGIEMLNQLFVATTDTAQRKKLAQDILNSRRHYNNYTYNLSTDERLNAFLEFNELLETCDDEKLLTTETSEVFRTALANDAFWVYCEIDSLEKARELYDYYVAHADTTQSYERHSLPLMLLALGEPKKAQPMMEAIYREYHQTGDSLELNENYCAWLGNMVKLYEALGDDKRLKQYYDEFNNIYTKIELHHARQKVDRLSTEYKVQQRDFELKDEMLRHERTQTINHGLFTALWMFLVIIGVILYYTHVVRQKNKVLAQHLNHLLDEKARAQKAAAAAVEMAEELKAEAAANNENVNENEDEDTAAETSTTAGSMSVERFIYALTQRQLFCDENFDRETLLAELHIPRKNFAAQFEQHTGTTVAQYVLNLRLEFAADMIRRQPNYTIDSIALDSGFSSRATFYRNFTRQFGITPTEYRDQSQSPS